MGSLPDCSTETKGVVGRGYIYRWSGYPCHTTGLLENPPAATGEVHTYCVPEALDESNE